MPGPPPKPAAKRQNRNTKSIGLVELRAIEAPAPSAGLLASTKAEWDDFWLTPHAALVTPAHVPALRRLFELRDERERCMREAKRAGRLVEGSQGQLVLNPLYKHVNTLDTEIRNLEDRFGLNPMAGLRLGAQFGEARRSLEDLNRDAEEESQVDSIGRFESIGV